MDELREALQEYLPLAVGLTKKGLQINNHFIFPEI